MSLGKCPACKKQISLEAQACPKCGQPLNDEWRDKERRSRDMKAKRCLTVFLLWIALIVGLFAWGKFVSNPKSVSTPKQIRISQDQYGAEWGFKVSSFILRCERRRRGSIIRPHVFLIVDQKTYGVNGPAITLGYPNSQDIMLRDQYDAFTFKSQNDLIPRGLQLCEWTDKDDRRNRLFGN